jgi:hypothetical protein
MKLMHGGKNGGRQEGITTCGRAARAPAAAVSVQGLGNQCSSSFVRLCQTIFLKKYYEADADGFRPFPMISNQFQSLLGKL